MASFDGARLDRIGAVGRRYVDNGQLPNSIVQVSDADGIVYSDVYGWADLETQTPVTAESIFRIFSMTKPITSLTLMQLFEEGHLLLEDPVEKFLPDMANPMVVLGPDDATATRPATRSITIKDLLTHTSGLTYGFMHQNAVDASYRERSLGDFSAPAYTLNETIRLLGEQPLLFDPGTAWNYSMSTDVCGAVIEAITGKTLAQAFSARVFEPLNMSETGFSVPASAADRFTSLYALRPRDQSLVRLDDFAKSRYLRPPAFLSGGGGLVSTIGDYQKFCSMLLAGGVGNGHRLIGRKTLEFMTRNHLPQGRLLNDLGTSIFAEVALGGMGFGLGFSVVRDPAANGSLCSVDEYAWGGAASTAFWIDPTEGLTTIFMTQLLPSDTYPIRRELRTAVNQALT